MLKKGLISMLLVHAVVLGVTVAALAAPNVGLMSRSAEEQSSPGSPGITAHIWTLVLGTFGLMSTTTCNSTDPCAPDACQPEFCSCNASDPCAPDACSPNSCQTTGNGGGTGPGLDPHG